MAWTLYNKDSELLGKIHLKNRTHFKFQEFCRNVKGGQTGTLFYGTPAK